jgi:hypothetical protein
MQNPFTTTFSKAPENTYILTDKTAEILENLSYDSPSESVYKITGVRGSGKTVVLAKVEESLRTSENKEKGWIVLDLNPNRDMLGQMAAMLENEGYGKKNIKSIGVNVSATVLGTGGGIGVSAEKEEKFFDIGVELERMIVTAYENGKKILIGIDEVSKTPEMISFTAEYGRWLRAGYPVYLICTGLYENMQEVSNVKNLTFFRRATNIKTEPLNFVRMTEMYMSKLNTDNEEAKRMSKITKGYAYAFQELGSLYFKRNQDDSLEEVIPLLKTELFAYSYEKIWEELTEADRFMIKLLTDKAEYKREEVLRLMGNKANSYSVYRDRLIKRGLLESRQGYISLSLPYFADYVKEYCMD